METFVGDEDMLEEAAYDFSEEPGKWAFCQMADANLSLSQVFADGFQLLCSLLLFSLLFLGRVYVHEGQAHVRLGHDERISRVGMADAHGFQLAVCLQTFIEYVDSLSDTVACRADCKAERLSSGENSIATGLQS